MYPMKRKKKWQRDILLLTVNGCYVRIIKKKKKQKNLPSTLSFGNSNNIRKRRERQMQAMKLSVMD